MNKTKSNESNGGMKVLKTSIIYILVNLINKGIGIITIPIFTRLLTTAEMGTVSTWISWLTILSPITSFSLASGSLYIAMNEYPEERDAYQSSALTLSTIISVFCLLIYLIFHKYMNKLFTLSTSMMTFMFIYLIFSPALDIWMVRQKYEYNTKKMAVITLSSNLVASILTVFLIIYFQNKDVDKGNIRIYGTYAILGIFSIFLYFYILKTGKVFLNKKFWNFGLTVSSPLIIHTLAKNILDVSDRSMISIYCGKDAVGVYGTVYSISTLSLIIWNAINAAFVPYLYDKLEKEDDNSVKDIRKISLILIFLYAVVCLMLTAIAPEIVKVLTTKQYYEAIYIIPAIAAGIFLACVYNLFANVILFYKKTIYVMLATVIAALVNIVLNMIFIPKWGYIAASYTTLFAYMILAAFQGIMLKKIDKRCLYDMKIIAIISFIVIGICLSFTIIYEKEILRYAIIAIILLCLFCSYRKVIEIIVKIKKKD